MFLGSQHQTSVVETEDTAHAFDVRPLSMYLLLSCQYCACFESLVEVYQQLLDLPVYTESDYVT